MTSIKEDRGLKVVVNLLNVIFIGLIGGVIINLGQLLIFDDGFDVNKFWISANQQISALVNLARGNTLLFCILLGVFVALALYWWSLKAKLSRAAEKAFEDKVHSIAKEHLNNSSSVPRQIASAVSVPHIGAESLSLMVLGSMIIGGVTGGLLFIVLGAATILFLGSIVFKKIPVPVLIIIAAIGLISVMGIAIYMIIKSIQDR